LKKLTCHYYTTETGKCPVKEFVDSLASRTQAKFFFVIGLLEEFGHLLPAPHAKYLGDSIFELRFAGAEGAVRVLYFFVEQSKAILTNGFVKKSSKTPRSEKELAVERRRAYLSKQKRGGSL